MRKIKPKKATRPFIPAASESVSNSKPNMVRTVCIRVITNPVPVIDMLLNIALLYYGVFFCKPCFINKSNNFCRRDTCFSREATLASFPLYSIGTHPLYPLS